MIVRSERPDLLHATGGNEPTFVDHHVDAVIADVSLAIDDLQGLLQGDRLDVDAVESAPGAGGGSAKISSQGPADFGVADGQGEDLAADLGAPGDGRVAAPEEVDRRLDELHGFRAQGTEKLPA